MARYVKDNAKTDRERNQALADLLTLGGKWNGEENARIWREKDGWAAQSSPEARQAPASGTPPQKSKPANDK